MAEGDSQANPNFKYTDTNTRANVRLKNKGGRPAGSILLFKIRTEFLEYVRKYGSVRKASAMCRIHHDTYTRWKKRAAEEPNGYFADFVLDVEKAKAELYLEIQDHANSIGKDDINYQKWKLEKTFPEEFGQTTQTNISITENIDTSVLGNFDQDVTNKANELTILINKKIHEDKK